MSFLSETLKTLSISSQQLLGTFHVLLYKRKYCFQFHCPVGFTMSCVHFAYLIYSHPTKFILCIHLIHLTTQGKKGIYVNEQWDAEGFNGYMSPWTFLLSCIFFFFFSLLTHFCFVLPLQPSKVFMSMFYPCSQTQFLFFFNGSVQTCNVVFVILFLFSVSMFFNFTHKVPQTIQLK